MKLTEKTFWDCIHQASTPTHYSHSLAARIKAYLKTLLGETFVEYSKSYRNYILWNVIYKKYMPTTDVKLLEVGSAPGDHLVRLRETFGVDPYGIEYSEIGVLRNRQLFKIHNIDPGHIICSDFFDDEFQEKYRETFDVVMSIGFVEHFADPESAIAKHINLLKKGGTFLVSVPNFRGFNYLMLWFFQKELIAVHNFKIMDKEEFRKCFTREGIEVLFCDYYGTFDFELFSARVPWKHVVWKFCILLQHALNLLFRLIFCQKGRESIYFSPFLLAVGVKKR